MLRVLCVQEQTWSGCWQAPGYCLVARLAPAHSFTTLSEVSSLPQTSRLIGNIYVVSQFQTKPPLQQVTINKIF